MAPEIVTHQHLGARREVIDCASHVRRGQAACRNRQGALVFATNRTELEDAVVILGSCLNVDGKSAPLAQAGVPILTKVMLDLAMVDRQLSRIQLMLSAWAKPLTFARTHGQPVLSLRLFGKYLKLVAMDPLSTFPRTRQELPNGRL